ncbi:MAG: ABC transporter permease [Phycisphaerales bacterium]
MPRAAQNQAESVPAIMAPVVARRNPLTRSVAGVVGLVFLTVMLVLCVGSLPWTMGREAGVARYNAGRPSEGRFPPVWVTPSAEQAGRVNRGVVGEARAEELARAHGISRAEVMASRTLPEVRALWPRTLLGTDVLGRSMLVRLLAGGGLSLAIGLAAAALSVCIGTLYGAVAGYAGGRVDGLMMRVVDVLYGLPYVLLVVLLAVASDAVVGEYVSRQRERAGVVRELARAAMVAEQPGAYAAGGPTRSQVLAHLAAHEAARKGWERAAFERVPPREMGEGARTVLDLMTLLVAIGGVSWLTMARVIRGQVLSLRQQAFVEAARALGLPPWRIFARHLLPNLVGPIVVYATLTVPQAVLQESFLSFLGIGVKPPLPSWGNLAAAGLSELNQYESNWWLLVFPCLLLGLTLLALSFLGEALREAMDPKRR